MIVSDKQMWIGVGVFVLMVVFILQNTQVVPFRFLFWEVRMSRVLLFGIMFATGFLAGWFFRKWR